MKNAKIVLVAQWDGWCGACAAERPLVLTRAGRQHLRTWLTGAADDSRPLLLTCRLCGTGVDVPLERDDPPVALDPHEPEPHESEPPAAESSPVDAVPGPAAAPLPAVPAQVSAGELTAGRQVVAQALGALLAQRAAVPALPVPSLPVPAVPTVAAPLATPVVAPALPLQRTPSSGGLAELQLLADGIDLLSSGRA